jgi:hypothetical protein
MPISQMSISEMPIGQMPINQMSFAKMSVTKMSTIYCMNVEKETIHEIKLDFFVTKWHRGIILDSSLEVEGSNPTVTGVTFL